ncbi:MAG: N-acetylmuramoyl-L-alanine amidase [Chloroflexi bacterium]|nr:N-acetylmuramoyl-L-alanine amidase [Chloroflexota bacterium]
MRIHRSFPFFLILAWLAACNPVAGTPSQAEAQPSPFVPVDSPPTSTILPFISPTPASSETPTLVPATPVPPIDTMRYAQNCDAVDRIPDVYERQFALEQMEFPTELSAEAQARLLFPVLVRPSCNMRTGNTPQAIVLHATRGGLVASISEFQERDKSSAHYMIDRDGQVYQLAPEGLVAFHVTCCLGAGGKVNEDYTQSIGIELVNKLYVNPDGFDGPIFEDYLESFGYRYWEDYPEAQIASLVILVEDITARWGIPLDKVIGHYQVNDNTDPGPALNLFWRRNGNPSRPPIFNLP